MLLEVILNLTSCGSVAFTSRVVSCPSFHRPGKRQKNMSNEENDLGVQATVLLDRDKYTVYSGTRCCVIIGQRR